MSETNSESDTLRLRTLAKIWIFLSIPLGVLLVVSEVRQRFYSPTEVRAHILSQPLYEAFIHGQSPYFYFEIFFVLSIVAAAWFLVFCAFGTLRSLWHRLVKPKFGDYF